MVVELDVNGTTFNYPESRDENWGDAASQWAEAITVGTLQKIGGSFPLSNEVDFGGTAGLKALYYKSRTDNPASAGQVRLARADVISFRNQANSADLDLGVNSSNQLTFNGSNISQAVSTVSDSSTIDFTLASENLTAIVSPDSLANTHINTAAAITRSKLAAGTTNRLTYNDGSTGALSDLSAITASRVIVSDANGLPAASSVTSTTLAFLDVTSSAQTQIDAKLNKSGGTMTGDLTLANDPSVALHAATKQYVDAVAVGIQTKDAVIVATTANGTLATAFDNGSTIDGVVIKTGDRLLIKDQTDGTVNGVYVTPAAGAPTRATDTDTIAELTGALVFVQSGTNNRNTSWTCTVPATGTLGVNNITWAQFSAAGNFTADGQGIELSVNEFSLELDGSTLSKSATGLKVADVGIANAQISASAAIARSKVAAGTTNRLVYNDGSTGLLSDLSALTASRVLVSDANGLPSASSTTTTTLGFLDVSSSAQTQLNNKLSLTGGALTGALTTTSTFTATSGISAGTTMSAPVFASAMVAHGSSGATETLDFTAGLNHSVELTGSPGCTFTFTAPAAGSTIRIILTQGSGGGKTVTWPTIKWVGGAAPTLSTTATDIDIVSLFYDGTSYYGVSALDFS